jgi:hypothetical protein
MARRSPIYTMLDPNVLSSGLMPDKHPVLAALWAQAANVRFFSGKVTRRVPSALAFSGTANMPVRGLSQQQDEGGTRWLWAATGGDVYRWYGPAPEVIYSGAGWVENQTLTSQATFFDFTHFGNWTIINGGVGKAVIFKSPTTFVFGDAATPTNVVTYMKLLNFIVAVGHGPRGTAVSWSNGDDIEVWDAATEPVANNLAGDLVFDDLNTRIRAAARLGQTIAVYAEDQMGILSYVGGAFLFGQRVVLDGIGAVGKAAVCSDGKSNYGVGRGGVWWTDSNSYRYIDEGFLHDYLQNGVNWDQASKIVAMRNDYTGCFEFYFPMGASLVISEGWSYDPRTGGWSPLPAASYKDERRLFNYVITGGNTGSISFADFSPTTAAPLTLRTRPLLMQVQDATGILDVHTDSRVDEVVMLLKDVDGVDFRLGTAQISDGPYEYCAWKTLDVTTNTYLLENMTSGVWWVMEFRSTKDNWKFDFQGFQFFGVVEGSQRKDRG